MRKKKQNKITISILVSFIWLNFFCEPFHRIFYLHSYYIVVSVYICVDPTTLAGSKKKTAVFIN